MIEIAVCSPNPFSIPLDQRTVLYFRTSPEVFMTRKLSSEWQKVGGPEVTFFQAWLKQNLNNSPQTLSLHLLINTLSILFNHCLILWLCLNQHLFNHLHINLLLSSLSLLFSVKETVLISTLQFPTFLRSLYPCFLRLQTAHLSCNMHQKQTTKSKC